MAPPWETRGLEQDEESRQAEAAAALAGMRGVASLVDDVRVELAFHFWAQDGALTLLSWKRDVRGTGRSEGMDSWVPGLDANLSLYVGERRGEVVLTLRRERQGWRLQSFASVDGTSKPLEAKTLPVRRTGVPVETLAQAHTVASQLTHVRVPEGGSASLLVEVMLDDDRVLGAEIVRYESQGGSLVRFPSP
ncbi:MAG TPA: hypothetical protein VEZ71_20050, partial [Archangium sp.]|nr:hypothetical protein [Archangium sp.]